LSKRYERREEAKEGGEEAKEIGTAEDLDRFSRRTVKVTREHNEECQKLLRLMGIPCVVVGPLALFLPSWWLMNLQIL
jgi:flap endonuclease-1